MEVAAEDAVLVGLVEDAAGLGVVVGFAGHGCGPWRVVVCLGRRMGVSVEVLWSRWRRDWEVVTGEEDRKEGE